MAKTFPYEFIVAEHDTRHNRVIRVSREGRILQEYSVEYPLDLCLLPQGHLLISSNLAIIEVDSDFREVWRWESQSPALFSCQLLPNGNVLCGDTFRSRICEVDRSGNVVRAMPFPYAGDYQPYYDMFRLVRYLPNDRLLVACHHDQKLAEFSWDGVMVWEVPLEGAPYMPLRLENGNTLVSLGSSGLIVEINPLGETVWRYDMVEDTGLKRGWIAGISQLRNGNLVFSDSKFDRLVEITADKKLESIFWNPEVLLHPSTHIILEADSEI